MKILLISLLTLAIDGQQDPAGTSQQETFMSVPIGSKFNLDRCETRKRNPEQACYLDTDYYTRSVGGNSGPKKSFRITVPVSKKPRLFLASDSWIGVRDDQIVAITTSTLGIVDQQLVLEALIEKYGQPTSKQLVPMANAFGTSYDIILASWKTATLSIEFYGSVGSTKEGRIEITTLSEAVATAAEAEALKKREPKL